MDMLKKIFPLSWKYTKDASNLIIGILIYLVAGIIAAAVIGLAGVVASLLGSLGVLLGVVLGLVGGLVDLYVFAGIVIQVLVFCKVI